MKTINDVIEYCLILPETYVDNPFDEPSIAIRNAGNKKMLLLMFYRENKLWLNLKCDPIKADFWRQAYSSVVSPYYLINLFLQENLLKNGASIVNIASTRAFQSQADTESYSAAKGGIVSLTHAMAVSLSGKARVNCISPGWIDTSEKPGHSGSDKTQHPTGRGGVSSDIAEMVLYLCSDKAGFITGTNFKIDDGMSKLMIYHNDCGWSYEEK